jgi:EAL domain-containing protein (putative c-di-GMP-specific phosphodiesterase class I)/GGDEF domain-containing protein/response regulator of citrate/malate metabolism
MKKVLVLDDSEEVQLLVSKILGKEFIVRSIMNVSSTTIGEIETFEPDLILLDVIMPEISGFDFCQEIKSTHLASIPVVMMTSLNDKNSIQKAFDSKADDFITKPLDINLLPYRVKFNIQQRENLSEVSLRKKTISRINDAAKIKYWMKDPKSPDLIAQETLRSYYYGLNIEELRSEEKDQLIEMKINAMAKLQGEGPQHLEYSLTDHEKTFTFVETISYLEGHIIGIIQNTTHLMEDQNELLNLAYFDEKTGLSNANSFRKKCKTHLLHAKREHHPLAIVTMRLVNLKEVSDFLGTGFYYKVIHYFRSLLPVVLRLPENEIFLTSEDEIRFMLSSRSDLEIQALAGEILELVRGKFSFKEKNYNIELSFGVSSYPKDGEEMEKLITHSQFASQDQHGTIFYSEKHRQILSQKLAIKAEVTEALEKNQFECYFQPQIELGSFKITGAELLIRWHHPTRGFTYPGYFIKETELNGQVVDIGFWNLKKTFDYCERWMQMGLTIKISMNLSTKQITKDKAFIKALERLLQESGVSPSLIGVEITETSFLEDFNLTVDFLHDLKKLGIKISLDDFGTGFSSLQYLKDLPIDCIKIDRLFVMNIKSDQFSKAFVSCITTLASHLSMEVMAEAVESEEDARILKSLGCHSVQGYSLPVSEEEFLKIVAQFN